MRDVLRQFYSIWQNAKPLQKIALIAVVVCLGTVLALTMIHNSGSYTRLASSDEKEIKRFLDSSGISYKEKSGSILVASNQAESLRDEITFLKEDKGFELFDSNTWIKGEKELQVLEMRALKGQLERDIASFDNIKSARVILDLAPSRKFGGQQYKTKASVILTLMPGAKMSDSQLSAITFHLAGAVRGLEASMVAISDTTGRLYQAIDGENQSVIDEAHLRDQITTLLDKMVGPEHFLVEGGKIFIDQSVENLPTIEAALAFLGEVSIHPIPFKKSVAVVQKRFGLFNIIFFVTMLGIAVAIAFPFVRKNKEQQLLKMATKVDMGVLARSLKDEDPEIVAWMLSYMEPARAEEMVASFPEGYQEAVLHHLAEMEKDEL